MIALSEPRDGGYFAEMISINQQSRQTGNSFNQDQDPLPSTAQSYEAVSCEAFFLNTEDRFERKIT